jgi:hypothetical protein
MIDQEVLKANEVWGIVVPTSPGRRHKWPEAIRVKLQLKLMAQMGIPALRLAMALGHSSYASQFFIGSVTMRQRRPDSHRKEATF